MKISHLVLCAGLLVSVSACDKKPEAQAPAAAPAAVNHSSTGQIQGFGAQGKSVVLEHQAFADGFMGAMTMSYDLADPKLAQGLKVGDKVEFTVAAAAGAYPIIAIKKIN